MFRRAFLCAGVLLCTATAFGQATTPTTESQTLQALLAEVRQLRQDVQTAAFGARRAQILIHRLYVQEAAVARATQRLDEVKSELNQLRAQRNYQEGQIKNYEDMRDHAEGADERKRYENAIGNFKAQLEALGPMEQETQAKGSEMEQQLRIEQAKLDQLQDELDRLDKAVMNAAIRQDSPQPSGGKLQ